LQQNRKQAVLYWPLIAKAASIILLLSASPSTLNKFRNTISASLAFAQTEESNSTIEINYSNTKQLHYRNKSIASITENRATSNIENLSYISASIQTEKTHFIVLPAQSVQKTSFEQEQFALIIPEKEVKSSKKEIFNLGLNLNSAAGSSNNQTNTIMGASLMAGISLSKKIALASGISWQNNTELYQQNFDMASSGMNSISTNENNSYNFVSIPLELSYQIRKKIGVKISSSFDYISKIENVKKATIMSSSYLSADASSSVDRSFSSNVSNYIATTDEINNIQALNNLRMAISYSLKTNKHSIKIEPFMQIPIYKTNNQLNAIPLVGMNLLYSIDFS
jgi:hypothetical protein